MGATRLLNFVYRPPAKLREGNVFNRVYLSVCLFTSVGKRKVSIELKCLLVYYLYWYFLCIVSYYFLSPKILDFYHMVHNRHAQNTNRQISAVEQISEKHFKIHTRFINYKQVNLALNVDF